MKKLISTLIFVFAFFEKGEAQQPDYIISNTLGKFEGTWQWVSGVDTVTLYLRKEKVNTSGNTYIDLIVGFHIYKQGTTVIEDSYSRRNLPNSTKLSTFMGSNHNGDNTLSGLLRDMQKSKHVRLALVLNNSLTSLSWNTKQAGTSFNEMPGYTLPRSIILTKL